MQVPVAFIAMPSGCGVTASGASAVLVRYGSSSCNKLRLAERGKQAETGQAWQPGKVDGERVQGCWRRG